MLDSLYLRYQKRTSHVKLPYLGRVKINANHALCSVTTYVLTAVGICLVAIHRLCLALVINWIGLSGNAGKQL
jgi:hypothetical protein